MSSAKNVILSSTSLKNTLSDFERFYAHRRRFYFHLLFWTCLSGVYIIDELLLNDIPINLILVIVFRQILQSIFFFYLTCYFILPKLLFKGFYFWAIASFIIPFLLAPLIDFIVFKAANGLLLQNKVDGADINQALFVTQFRSIFNREEITLSIMPIILRTMPAFLMKLLVSTIHFFSDAIKQKKKQHELEMENLQLEVNFLKSQMNPHYLFNTLNNIYSYAYLKDDRALDLISDLSEVLSYTLYESKDTFVPLDKELIFLEHYMNLEKSRLNSEGAKLETQIDRQGADGLMIAPLLLFPFVENAIKHGIETNKKTGWLQLNASISDGRLTFCIKNSKAAGGSRPTTKNEKIVGGIGLSTTRRRLRLLYPSAHEIKIMDTKITYSVFLNIKCLRNEPKPELHYR